MLLENKLGKLQKQYDEIVSQHRDLQDQMQ